MKKMVLVALASMTFALPALADSVKIEFGKDYSGYTNDELRRRVWLLERAVAQLQDQVFQLAMRNGGSAPVAANWTCQMQSFGKTFVSAGVTRSAALAEVLKKCSDNSNAIHCKESDAKCAND